MVSQRALNGTMLPDVEGVFPRNFVDLLRRGLCLHNFEAEHPDELTLKHDEYVLIMSEPEKDWFKGFVEGRPNDIGLFPATFLKLL
eukprot:SAG31_NODE_162_length_21892_cov_343.171936_9_plen_86_part_00